jgi:hypothetical protein
VAIDDASEPLTNNVVRLTTVIDARLKILEALGAGAVDFESAQAADVKATRASAAELRATFERFEALLAAKGP